VTDHAERALRRLPAAPDLVIVDPPRCGLGEVVIGALGQQQPRFLIYVSCAPPSLARDLAALQDLGYRVSLLELFDFYPQTYHVESLAFLER
jgi:23S rRNA (uracil1939-C5)-methyltransferase